MEKVLLIQWAVVTCFGVFGGYHYWRMKKILKQALRTMDRGGTTNGLEQ